MRRIGWVLLAAAVACGSPTKVGKQPSWRTPSVTGDSPPGATSSQVVVFAPSGTAVKRYNDPPILPAPSSPLADRVVSAIAEASRAINAKPPIADGRLFAAAAALATVVPEDAPLPYPLVEFALQRHGIIEPSPHLMVIWGPLGDAEAVMEQLRTRIAEIVAAGPFARIGVGTADRGNGEGAIILALQASHLDTEPIPRSIPAGGAFELKGVVHKPFRDTQVFITRETGEVEEPQVIRSGNKFRSVIQCGAHKGKQQVEVTAADASGSTVLANFPIWCGERPPTSIRVVPPDDGPTENAEAAEKRMFKLINRDRARGKLPPLKKDSVVADVARAHSREMFETGVVAHVSPRTGSASDRVRAASVRASVVLENVARAYGVGETQEGLMNSPGHRANVLSKDVTHVGVGIVVGDKVAGRRELFVTQVFVHKTGKLNRKTAIRKLRAKVAEVSTARYNSRIAAVAQKQADDLARGLDEKIAKDRAEKRAAHLFRWYSRIGAGGATVVRLGAFDPTTAFANPATTHYGLGVAQGDHPVIGPGSIFIVIVLAESR